MIDLILYGNTWTLLEIEHLGFYFPNEGVSPISSICLMAVVEPEPNFSFLFYLNVAGGILPPHSSSLVPLCL